MAAPAPFRFSELHVGRVRLYLAEGVSPDWAREILTTIVPQRPAEVVRHGPPPGSPGETAVKIYVRRPKHNLLRLLRASRAELEARGYRAFAARGLAVPELLLWGESRRRGLFEFGLVVTRWIDAPSVADTFLRTRDPALLFATAAELGVIHQAGLAHGDPYARNFLATKPRPTPLDVASWSKLRKASHVKDLVRFACSIIKMTADFKLAEATLLHYAESGRPLPLPVAELIRRAVAYAKVKKIRA